MTRLFMFRTILWKSNFKLLKYAQSTKATVNLILVHENLVSVFRKCYSFSVRAPLVKGNIHIKVIFKMIEHWWLKFLGAPSFHLRSVVSSGTAWTCLDWSLTSFLLILSQRQQMKMFSRRLCEHYKYINTTVCPLATFVKEACTGVQAPNF